MKTTQPKLWKLIAAQKRSRRRHEEKSAEEEEREKQAALQRMQERAARKDAEFRRAQEEKRDRAARKESEYNRRAREESPPPPRRRGGDLPEFRSPQDRSSRAILRERTKSLSPLPNDNQNETTKDVVVDEGPPPVLEAPPEPGDVDSDSDDPEFPPGSSQRRRSRVE